MLDMPHVVLNKKIDLQKFFNSFEEMFHKEPIIKIQNVFLDTTKRIALLPTIVIEEKNQHFLIEINVKDVKTTIRLFPETDPEKTPGVKTSLALLSINLMNFFPDTNIIKTNIQDYFSEVQ